MTLERQVILFDEVVCSRDVPGKQFNVHGQGWLMLGEIQQINDQTLNREITLIDRILGNSGFIAQFKEEYERSQANL